MSHSPRVVLFRRHFRSLTGGHLKVWDYFNHVAASPEFTPEIYFTPPSRLEEPNPWHRTNRLVENWSPHAADVLFVAGTDWDDVPDDCIGDPGLPVLNLVQSLRHADAEDPRHRFLRHPAIRICVSAAIEEALRNDPTVNGPVFHVPVGLDHGELPAPGAIRNDVVIVAVKAPQLGRAIDEKLQRRGRRVLLLDQHLPRRQFLQEMAASRIVLCLPLLFEGLYLPALEAMAMRRVVICADVPAVRSYLTPGRDGLLPEYSVDAIANSAEDALASSSRATSAMAAAAAETASHYTLEREREAFNTILHGVDELWDGCING